MKKEKTIYTKLNTIADWIIRFVVINILVIIFSLPIITLYPAFSAGYRLFYEYSQKNEEKIIASFLRFFKENFKKKMKYSLIFVLIILFALYNMTYYLNSVKVTSQMFYLLGYYMTIAILITLYIVMLYSMFILKVYPHIKLRLMIRLSLALSGKFFIKTVFMIVFTISPIGLWVTPFTATLFVFMGVSMPLCAIAFISVPIVTYLEGLGEQHV